MEMRHTDAVMHEKAEGKLQISLHCMGSWVSPGTLLPATPLARKGLGFSLGAVLEMTGSVVLNTGQGSGAHLYILHTLGENPRPAAAWMGGAGEGVCVCVGTLLTTGLFGGCTSGGHIFPLPRDAWPVPLFLGLVLLITEPRPGKEQICVVNRSAEKHTWRR